MVDLQCKVKELSHAITTKTLPYDLGNLVTMYNKTLSKILDSHTPLVTRSARDHPSAPWITVHIRMTLRQRRGAERKWRKTCINIHQQIFIEKRNAVKQEIESAKSQYHCQKMDTITCSKDLYSIKDLLVRRMFHHFPTIKIGLTHWKLSVYFLYRENRPH